MGCLNSNGQFKHYFGNIHLSGQCNRSCYFCIGQHMMALDSLDVLDTWPLLMPDVYGNKHYQYTQLPSWCNITYWDVHYTEVESINLYANGVVSDTYPITLGHDPITGNVLGQENFSKSGRIRQQWVDLKVSK